MGHFTGASSISITWKMNLLLLNHLAVRGKLSCTEHHKYKYNFATGKIQRYLFSVLKVNWLCIKGVMQLLCIHWQLTLLLKNPCKTHYLCTTVQIVWNSRVHFVEIIIFCKKKRKSTSLSFSLSRSLSAMRLLLSSSSFNAFCVSVLSLSSLIIFLIFFRPFPGDFESSLSSFSELLC